MSFEQARKDHLLQRLINKQYYHEIQIESAFHRVNNMWIVLYCCVLLLVQREPLHFQSPKSVLFWSHLSKMIQSPRQYNFHRGKMQLIKSQDHALSEWKIILHLFRSLHTQICIHMRSKQSTGCHYRALQPVSATVRHFQRPKYELSGLLSRLRCVYSRLVKMQSTSRRLCVLLVRQNFQFSFRREKNQLK